jgi:acetylornithine deacetylase/succinyl-diaminopimelate desuccinylase-like protein
LTTSLRGLVDGVLTVEVLTEGVHSGNASGIVPSSFRIARQLLDRIEDSATGEVTLAAAHTEIPDHRRREAATMVEAISHQGADRFPFVEGVEPMSSDPVERALAQTWSTTVSYIGIDGIPSIASAGNVLRPSTSLKLSLGPGSNAHGSNEFLDVAYAEKLTVVMAHVLQGHANR